MNMHKTKIGFLFGAGAEGPGNYGILNGHSYMLNTFFQYDEEILNALKKRFDKIYFNNHYKYKKNVFDAANQMLRSYVRFKCEMDSEFLSHNKEDISCILTKADLEELNKKSTEKITLKNNSASVKNIKNEFKQIMTGDINKYSDIKHKLLKELFNEDKNGMIKYDIEIGLSGNLDKYFHTIINPSKYGLIKFSYIFNYYWFCYFAVVKCVVKYLSKQNCDLSQYQIKNELNYEFILNNLDSFTKMIYEYKINNAEKTYYSLIKKKIESNKNLVCNGVATTNYFNFVETLCKKPIYLNGQLRHFEFPEVLEVRDLTKDNLYEKNIFFPFIFGQSLVKPIVNPIQTDSFYRFDEMLRSIDVLIVLGFNISEDDNHINAFLHKLAVNNEKRLIYVTETKSEDIGEKLKCSNECIEWCEVKYGCNETVVEKIFNHIGNEVTNI